MKTVYSFFVFALSLFFLLPLSLPLTSIRPFNSCLHTFSVPSLLSCCGSRCADTERQCCSTVCQRQCGEVSWISPNLRVKDTESHSMDTADVMGPAKTSSPYATSSVLFQTSLLAGSKETIGNSEDPTGIIWRVSSCFKWDITESAFLCLSRIFAVGIKANS